MATGGTNITTDFRERQYSAYHQIGEVPQWFVHKRPAFPTAVVFPGTLTPLAQREVGYWLMAGDTDKPTALSRCTQADAIAKIAEYTAQYADPVYLAALAADRAARITQYRLFLADSFVDNKAILPPSADDTGTGSGTVSAELPQADNTA